MATQRMPDDISTIHVGSIIKKNVPFPQRSIAASPPPQFATWGFARAYANMSTWNMEVAAILTYYIGHLHTSPPGREGDEAKDEVLRSVQPISAFSLSFCPLSFSLHSFVVFCFAFLSFCL